MQVEEKDVIDTFEELRKRKAHEDLHKSGKPHTEGDEKDLVLAELNDEFAKTLGQFKDLNDLKEKLKTNLLDEKKLKENQIQKLNLLLRKRVKVISAN